MGFFYIFVKNLIQNHLRNYILSLLLVCLTTSAQEKTLFWEISGNGLTKKSYLYGTMHVSDKVSYHLSDAFFKNLLNADMVANESDPETWNDLTDVVKEPNFDAKANFYTEFYKSVVNKNDVKAVFNITNNFFNNLLSSIGGETSDYQENTVLDMFIYQTGRKYNKKNVGLEDAKGSLIPILKIKEEDAKPKDENLQLLVKLMKNRPFNEVLKQYYREKDIVMLDSIYKLMMSKKAHDVLITIRNENMTKSIDSLVKKGSLFSAVGAAHLAGNEGIIALLQKRGYTVKPIVDVFSESGNKQKKNIEDYFPNPGFVTTSTSDGMLTMPLTKNVFEEFATIGAPDFTNGGVINIRRVPLNYYLNKKENLYNIKALDSLFFENIPGTILDKKMFEVDNISGYDVKNITKTGSNQRYKFYVTPLEIIGVSMTGVGNYVRQFENEIFDNIKLKSSKETWETMMPNKGGFSVELPSFYSAYGNNKSYEDLEIQAYDPATKSYYFLTEKTNNDTDFLENSEFEQHQIQYEFYLQHDAAIENSNYDKVSKSLETSSKIGDKNIRLKTIINGDKYYLLGTINASESDANRFFSSFKTTSFIYKNETSVFTDSINKYRIEIPKKLNDKLFLNLGFKEKDTKNQFEEKTKYASYRSETRKNVTLLYNKFSKYESIATIDSLRINFREYFLKEDSNFKKDTYDDYDYDHVSSLLSVTYKHKGITPSKWDDYIQKEEEKYEMLSETFDYDKEKNIYVLNNIVSRQNALQAIKYKTVFINDSYYMLSTLINRNYKNDDAFIEKTFNSIEPYGENLNHNYSIFDDKINLFINDANSESDTIRYSAMNSVYDLDITKKDLPAIKTFIETFTFKDSETSAIQSLMKKIGLIQDESVIPFLDNLYRKEDVKTTIQLGVIQALINQKTKKSYQKIIELLEYDLPISDNEYDITNLFENFEDDLEHSKELFPKIFQFYSVKEYNEPIISFCNLLLDQNLVEGNKIKSFKKMILTNAKLEYKRVASWKEKNKPDEETIASDDVVEDYDYNANSANVNSLKNYIGLLYEFKNDTAINDYFKKVKKLNLPEIDLEFTRLGIVNNRISNEEIQAALNNEENRFVVINLLLSKNKDVAIKLSDDEIAKSALLNLKGLTVKDTINYIDKKIVEQAGKQTVYYFYKAEKKSYSYDIAKKIIYTMAFVLDNNKINPLAFKMFPDEFLEDDDEMNKTIDLIIKKSMNEDHKRASFEKVDPNKNRYFYNDY